MADLDRFESDLAALIDMYRVQDHVGICTSDVARRLTEFLGIMKVCHEESRDIELFAHDWCACGWSDDPHLRSEHEPAGTLPDDAPTPPHATCDKFESQAGAFAVVQASVCATCGASARAHGITEVGPPTQIAETLTPLED